MYFRDLSRKLERRREARLRYIMAQNKWRLRLASMLVSQIVFTLSIVMPVLWYLALLGSPDIALLSIFVLMPIVGAPIHFLMFRAFFPKQRT